MRCRSRALILDGNVASGMLGQAQVRPRKQISCDPIGSHLGERV